MHTIIAKLNHKPCAGNWSIAGPKTKMGEAKRETYSELICSIQFWSNVSE